MSLTNRETCYKYLDWFNKVLAMFHIALREGSNTRTDKQTVLKVWAELRSTTRQCIRVHAACGAVGHDTWHNVTTMFQDVRANLNRGWQDLFARFVLMPSIQSAIFKDDCRIEELMSLSLQNTYPGESIQPWSTSHEAPSSQTSRRYIPPSWTMSNVSLVIDVDTSHTMST